MSSSIKFNKFLSAIAIVSNALTAAGIFTFSLFAPSFTSNLNLSLKQISTIASVSNLVHYISAVFWGSLADRVGTNRVSLLAGILSFSGYGILSYLLSSPPDLIPHPVDSNSTLRPFIIAILAYSLCGIATAAAFFSAITGSTQIFGSTHPGLSVAGPSALFAFSPILLSFLGTQLFSQKDAFDSSGYLAMLAFLTLLVNSFSAFQLKPSLPKALSDLNSDSSERTALLSSNDISQPSSSQPPPTEPDSALSFLLQPTVWLLGIIVLLASGPAEMTIASIGSVLDVQQPGIGISYKAKHVQLMSISNTLTRIISGWLSDELCGSHSGRRLIFLSAGPFLYVIACFYVATSGRVLWVLSLATGITYGIVFSIAPSLVAIVWPISSFGRNYGLILSFSATGSFIFTLLFGLLVKTSQTDEDSQSLQLVYALCGLFEFISVGLAALLYQVYWRHHRNA
ncbi:hypothetical protein O181_045284 [Austropuccinia psidii MF-1]|uniref:Major facilitator superfamily (MFS) profile domain-containing protein n=1 Tax=Austropuccinia psidii MF-1 TaxID=1389203 RepID=A0A9Q3HK88_9BASI|nr:hypothetical protein [Austropuccinia psidii MF-1]